MGAHALKIETSSPLIGPFEKITSRITVRDIMIIAPPPPIPLKRMVGSVHWSGLSHGTIELAEHLCNYPKLLERSLRKAELSGAVCRIDFLGSKRDRWFGKGPLDLAPRVGITTHPVLRRDSTRTPWRIDWFSNLEYAKCLMVFSRK